MVYLKQNINTFAHSFEFFKITKKGDKFSIIYYCPSHLPDKSNLYN
jgi:hypothetical protein